MQMFDGKLVSLSVKDQLKTKTDLLIAAGKKVPHLAAILIGSNGASETYVASKVKTCNEIGFKNFGTKREGTRSADVAFDYGNLIMLSQKLNVEWPSYF